MASSGAGLFSLFRYSALRGHTCCVLSLYTSALSCSFMVSSGAGLECHLQKIVFVSIE